MATNSSLLAQLAVFDTEVPFAGQVSGAPQKNNISANFTIPALIFQGNDPGRGNVESAIWSFCLPTGTGGYTATTGLEVHLKTNAPKAGNVVWSARWQLVGATDVPNPITENFPAIGAANDTSVTTTYAGAGAEVEVTLQCTIAKIQNGQTTAPAAGDFVRLCITRVVTSASDTLQDYAKLFAGYVKDY